MTIELTFEKFTWHQHHHKVYQVEIYTFQNNKINGIKFITINFMYGDGFG